MSNGDGTALSYLIVSGPMLCYLVNAAWELPLIAGAGWLAGRTLAKSGPRAEHAASVGTLALALATPAAPLLRWLSGGLSGSRPGTHAALRLVRVQAGSTPMHGTVTLPAVAASWLVSLYVAASLYFVMRLGWSIHTMLALVDDASPVSLTVEQDDLWRLCTRSYSLQSVRILSSNRISGPLTLGCRKPILLLPAGFLEKVSAQDLLATFAHECAHVQRQDFARNLFYEVISLGLSFHPVTWMLKSRIAQTREMVCDRMATEQLIAPHRYAQSLLRLAVMIYTNSRVRPSHAIGIFDANIMEKRVMILHARARRISPGAKYGMILATLLLLLSVAAGGASMAVAVALQPAAQDASSSTASRHVYKLGDGVSAPVLIFSVDPEFPEAARKNKGRFQGICHVGLVVDAMGVPEDVHVTKSLAPDFDANAVQAVRQYRFKPAKRSGEPVAVALTVEVNFQKF